ncbi:MAG TPA: hypothetical protein VFU31_01300 [Candidatus Binatia bacterium]|nr:hypothetical protein [Candidatus Binatia bacterium]
MRSLALMALILTSSSALLAQVSQPEEGQIRGAFLSYKEAILQQQGQSAVSLVNRATLQYYARMKTLALRGQEKEVRLLTPMNKIMVLSLRHRLSIDDLRRMTPDEIFIHAVNHGWIGKNSVLDSDIGQMQVFGNDASAEYVKGGRRTPLKYRFTKEDGHWKIDLTALMPAADQAMGMLIKKKGIDEDAFIISLVESVSGKKVLPSIWQPPVE